jgi:hypothetical protein
MFTFCVGMACAILDRTVKRRNAEDNQACLLASSDTDP